MAGMRPSDQPRDYSELKKTHDQVARASAESATALLSKEQLQEMSDHYSQFRKAANLQPSPAELGELSELARMQAENRERLDRAHGPHPTAQQNHQRELLDHQHLAERVGTEAHLFAQRLREQRLPGADGYDKERRRAYETAHQLQERRQNLGPDHARDVTRAVQQQDQQKQAEVQEALRGGKTLSAEQKANAPADAKQAIDRQERNDAAPNANTGRDQVTPRGPVRPGNTGSGGRSR
jgi:hypothetical protein